jgi:hypothetical protein
MKGPLNRGGFVPIINAMAEGNKLGGLLNKRLFAG